MSLCDTTYAKRAADLSGLNTQHLQDLLDAATALIENYCDRTFASTAYTATQDGTGAQWIYADNPEIISFTQVIIESPDGTTETVAASNFRYNAKSGKIWFTDDSSSTIGIFPEGFKNIQIDYTGGYATIPAAVQQACLQVARALYAQQAGGQNAAFQSERMGEHNFTRVSANQDPLTGSARALLEQYVRMQVI